MSALQTKANQLFGRQETLLQQKTQLLVEIDSLSELISHDDAVMQILNQLQDEYSTNAVELYSELLTSMVRGVIPDYSAQIVLEPGVYANKPALDIYAVSQGQREPIDDQGGSVSNLLAAGLRFIGLALSPNRRIAILDESDCWLEGRLVPSFLSCIHDLCSRLGLQVIFVSHHQYALDEVGVAKIRLEKRNGVTRVASKESATLEHAASPDARVNAQAVEGVGLRYVRLQNYMAHEDSIIELEPGLTALIGDNNVGKSVITRAFSDLLSNNRNPNRIRRSTQESCVRIGLEGGYELLWQLAVTGKSQACKGSYALLDDESNVIEFSKDATQPPPWLHDVLAMEPVNGLQMHIGHQKDPLFVLNPAISRHKRAELIQLGDEYNRINSMIKTHRNNIKSYRAALKSHQASIDAANKQLTPLRGIDVVQNALSPVDYPAISELKPLESFLGLLDSQRVRNAHQAVDLALGVDITPALNTQTLQMLQQFGKMRTTSQQPLVELVSGLNTSLEACEAITGYENDLRAIKAFAGTGQNKPSAIALKLINQGLAIDPLDIELNSLHAFIDAQESVSSTQNVLNETQRALSTLEQQLLAKGAICPTCKQTVQGDHYETRHH